MARRRPFELTANAKLEHPRQVDIRKALTTAIAPPGRLSFEGVMWFAMDIADYGGSVPGTRIGRGIIAGLPDTWVLWLGRYYLIEIKTDTGELSHWQQAIAAAVLGSGGRVAVARDWIEVLRCLDQWQVPHKRMEVR